MWNNTPPNKAGSIQVIDAEGFRSNVGIILANDTGQLLWARRIGGRDAWQFPQGGINPGESVEQALFRELEEEVGLTAEAVDIVAATRGWLRYRLPRRFLRRGENPLCIGQKQKWFLLRMLATDEAVRLDLSGKPEFDHWQWVSYWYPLDQVVAFKREVYRRALKELAPPLGRVIEDTAAWPR
ncbi:RNA pyrophosphohydrolase [Kineobactrum salinum]|uniref:RNA pyrophosphohydrolase n=1 Tax=Kineobactrum salinum TaxID=2708301 RepID=A0A6C0U0E4_9GAMM|nr:RNA pyrophosphohydrolase [Kineobactrum salinum]